MPAVSLASTAPALGLAFVAGVILAFSMGTGLAEAVRPVAVALAVASVLGFLISLVRGRRPWLVLLLVLPLAAGLLRGTATSERPPPWTPPTAGRIELSGVVDAPLQTRGAAGLAILRIVDAPGFPAGGRIQAALPPLTEIEPGDRVLVIGSFLAPDPSSPSGAALLARGIVATTSFPEIVRLAEPSERPAISGMLSALRRSLQDALERALPQPQAGLATGLLIGATSGLTDDLRASLIGSGTTHLVVVSGYNISLVAAALIGALRGRRWLGLTIPLVGIWTFTVLAGASSPSVRAAVMASVTVIAVRLGRGADPLAALALATAGMLALSPELALDLGFQLSALATLGLIALQPRIADLMPHLPTWARQPLAATLAAQIATLPILASAFHQISAVAPVSNALAAPAVPLITILGALTAPSVAVVPALAPLAGVLLIGPSSYLLWVIEQTAQWPHALVAAPEISWVIVTLYAVALLLWSASGTPEGRDLFDRIRSRPRTGWVLAALPLGAIVGTLAFTRAIDGPPTLSLTLFDAGGTHAIFGRTPSGRSLLIDGGRSPAAMTSALGRRLGLGENHLSLVVLTAMDSDRLPGVVVATERYTPELAAAPAGAQSSALYERWRTATGSRLLEIQDPVEILIEPGLRLELTPLVPAASAARPTQPVPTLALRVVYGETAIFFAPLASATSLRQLARQTPVAADVLIVPRGAANDSLDAELLARLAPRAAILPVSTGLRASFPDAGLLGLLGDAPLFRTDRHGSIEMRSDGSRTWVIPERRA